MFVSERGTKKVCVNEREKENVILMMSSALSRG